MTASRAATTSVASRILLVRHGESVWNAAGRWQGHADPPLSDEGRAQAARAARAVKGAVDRVHASDLARAHHTARIIAEGLSLALDVELDVELRERDIGPWSGLTMAEVEAGWPGYVAAGRRPEGAELDDAMWSRISRALLRVARGGGTPLVVSHGGVIALTERKLGKPLGKIHNLEGRWLEVRGDGLELGPRLRLDPTATREAVETTGRDADKQVV